MALLASGACGAGAGQGLGAQLFCVQNLRHSAHPAYRTLLQQGHGLDVSLALCCMGRSLLIPSMRSFKTYCYRQQGALMSRAGQIAGAIHPFKQSQGRTAQDNTSHAATTLE